jgi:NAD(P)-dependent dehydrogenase (short-subunit alcohol dehydrogenase family)
MPDQRIVVITGATRGLGRAMADGFVARGHVVAGCGRDAERVADLRTSHGPPHRFDALDVTDDAAVRAWAEAVLDSVGVPDLLLNNAALMTRPAPLWQVPREEFDRLLDVNVKGVVNVLRHFVPAMVERGRGVIVNFSSGWGRSVSAGVAPYNASKFAVEGLTQALAQELPRGMAAVPLNPGVIDTDMLRLAWSDGASHYPDPSRWAATAVPFLLALGPKDNGRSLTVPGS